MNIRRALTFLEPSLLFLLHIPFLLYLLLLDTLELLHISFSLGCVMFRYSSVYTASLAVPYFLYLARKGQYILFIVLFS